MQASPSNGSDACVPIFTIMSQLISIKRDRPREECTPDKNVPMKVSSDAVEQVKQNCLKNGIIGTLAKGRTNYSKNSYQYTSYWYK